MKHMNDNEPLTFISMFSGIEAASVAFGPLGWRAICFAEIEKFPSAVLAHHYPDTPNVGDMSAHDWSQYAGSVDIVCGGPPCQAFSVAGLRESLDDDRGNLSLVYMKAIHAIKPRNAIIENVPGWLSVSDNAFGCFLAGLVGADAPLVSSYKRGRWPNAGMVDGPKGRAAWRILDAQYFGLSQRRKRVIVVADFGNGADPAAVLFEPESVRRDSPPSRETGEGVAAAVSARTKGGGGLGTDFDLDGGLINYAPPIARCVATREGSSQDYESTTMVAVGVTGPISHALKAEGADASEDDTGRGTPIIAFVQNSRDEVRLMDGNGQIASSLSAEPGMHQQTFLAQTVALRGREDGGTAEPLNDNRVACMSSQLGAEIELAPTLRREPGGLGYPTSIGSAVRRLTPRECERLQGFPDDYTAIPWRGKPADQCPDGPRYKALGNSWAVPLFTWLGRRIEIYMPPIAANDNDKQEIQRAA